MNGSWKRKASISQEISTSSGSLVRRLGTIAMSSNPYARRPDLPFPISISTFPTFRTPRSAAQELDTYLAHLFCRSIWPIDLARLLGNIFLACPHRATAWPACSAPLPDQSIWQADLGGLFAKPSERPLRRRRRVGGPDRHGNAQTLTGQRLRPQPGGRRPDRERPDRGRPDRERPDRERPDRERPDRERPDRKRAPGEWSTFGANLASGRRNR